MRLMTVMVMMMRIKQIMIMMMMVVFNSMTSVLIMMQPNRRTSF